MKRIYISILMLLAIFCIPIYNKATTTATVYLKSNKDLVEIGEEIEISFYILDAKTVAFNTTIYFDETKLELVDKPENSNVNENQIKIVWYDVKGGSGAKENELGKIKFRTKNNGIANFVINGEFYTEKGQLIQTKFEALQVQIGKEETNLEMQAKEEKATNTQTNNPNLQALRLDIEGIVPNFEPNIYNYDLTIGNNINDIEVLAVAQNPKAKVEISGNTGLKQGINTINIKIISEDKTQEKNYKIRVTKTSNPEASNTNLEILAIENVLLNPPFENNITQYNIEVSNEITKLNIFAVPENENGKVEIKGNDNLKEGNNLITITVTAPNGITKRNYTINVYKRNLEEDELYKKEEEENEQKLKEAYEIEKTSIENENNSEENAKPKNNYAVMGLVGIILVISVIGGGTYYKKKYS